MRRLSIWKRRIALYLPLLCIFDSYCITYVGTLPITLSFLGIVAVFVLGVLEFIFAKKRNIKPIKELLVLVLLIIISVLSTGNMKLTSIGLYILYFSSYFFSRYRPKFKEIKRSTRITLFVINVLAVYAIWQMIAWFLFRTRPDLIIEGHMVTGFNRTNLIYISTLIFPRSNAIYLEPSFLSQFSVYGMILAITRYKWKLISKKRCIFYIILNSIALITSVAGTGLLLAVLVFGVYIIRRFNLSKVLKILFLGIGLGIVLLIFLPDNLKNYLIRRVTEVSDVNMSGGMRFSYPYSIMLKNALNHPFGISPGNEYIAIITYYPEAGMVTVASGYAKMGIELGLLGLIYLLYIEYNCRKNGFMIFVFLISINFLSGALLQTFFWGFMISMNYRRKPLKRRRVHRKGGYVYVQNKTCTLQNAA